MEAIEGLVMTILSLLILIINGHQCDNMVYEPTIIVKPQVVPCICVQSNVGRLYEHVNGMRYTLLRHTNNNNNNNALRFSPHSMCKDRN